MSLVTAAVFFLIGWCLATREQDVPWERACYAAIAGASLWLSSLWLLALTHTLTRPFLGVRLLLAIIAAGVLLRRRLAVHGERGNRVPLRRRQDSLFFLPLLGWCAFLLWRGAISPPATHDALAYHLPKATLMVRAHGFEYFAFLTPAIRTLPVNYELLLAEELVWMGSDRLTEWVSVIFYLFFVTAATALASRWWNASRETLATVALVAASVPVVLLNSGAHKNDLMVGAFIVAALVAAGRWLANGERRALLLMVCAFACAIGTKPQAGLLALVLAPVVAIRLIRRPRGLAMLAVVSAVAFLALGGVVYLVNYTHEGAFLNAKDASARSVEIVPYGDWRNLWQGPYVLLAAPFSRDELSLAVPWERTRWFWRRYELYFSHLGVPFAIGALLAPFAMIWTRRLRRGSPAERAIVTSVALMTFLVMLPVGFRPHGLYAISLPRYSLFLLPLVLAWTLAPLTELTGRRRMVLFAAAVWFSAQAVEYGSRDRFIPLSYLRYARHHPGTRVVPFDPNRAASIADRAAGPRDPIAIDAGFGTWLQPAFGRDLRRPVEFIPPGSDPPQISPAARWVVVDRGYAAVWGHPQFSDLSQARQYLQRGQPEADDLRVISFLRADPHFQAVYDEPKSNQAVFRRIP